MVVFRAHAARTSRFVAAAYGAFLAALLPFMAAALRPAIAPATTGACPQIEKLRAASGAVCFDQAFHCDIMDRDIMTVNMSFVLMRPTGICRR